MDLMPLKSGMTVEVFQDGEKIDEGLILSTSVCANDSIPKIEYKSTFLRLEGIIEFVYLQEQQEEGVWQFLVKNPMNPSRKLCHKSTPGFVITPLKK